MGKKVIKLDAATFTTPHGLPIDYVGAFVKVLCHLRESPLPGIAYTKRGEPITNATWAWLLGVKLSRWVSMRKKFVDLGWLAVNKDRLIYAPRFRKFRPKEYQGTLQKEIQRKMRKSQKLILREPSDLDVQEIFQYYCEKVRRCQLYARTKFKVKKRLRVFTVATLKSAVDNAVSDQHFMQVDSKKSPVWFFNSNDRIVYFLNLSHMRQREQALYKLKDKEIQAKVDNYMEEML